MSQAEMDSAFQWDDLLPELVKRIVSLLPPLEVVFTVPLISRTSAKLFRSCPATARLSEPIPHHAFLSHWSRPKAVHNLALKQRRQLLILTARSGCLANLEFALAVAGCSLTRDVFNAAAGGGHLEVCIWLLARDCPRGTDTVAAAARAGHLVVVRWLLQQLELEPDKQGRLCAGFEAWAAAAGAGQWELCEGLLADGIPYDTQAPKAAAEAGHVGLTDWLLQLPWPPQQPLAAAAAAAVGTSKQLAAVDVFVAAAYGFELASLQQLHATLQSLEPSPPPARVPITPLAVWGGRAYRALVETLASPTPDWRDKLQWLTGVRGARAGHLLWDENAVYSLRADALVSRPDAEERLEQLMSMLDTESRCMSYIMMAAVRASNLPLLRYLAGERWWLRNTTNSLATLAAEVGDLEVLGVLKAHGWGLYPTAVRAAAWPGHLHVLQWLAGPEAGPAGEAALKFAMFPSLMEVAVESDSVAVMEWLRGRGCPWGEDTFTAAARAGSSAAFLEWLAAEGCPMAASGEPYLEAGRNGDFATLRCLRRLGCPWGPGCTTFNRAVGSTCTCSLQVLQWLLAEGCPVNWEAAWRQLQQRTDPEAAAVRAWAEAQMPGTEALDSN